MRLVWHAKTFDKLSGDDIYAMLKLRADVFIVEQGYVCQDIDGLDRAKDILHLRGCDEKGVTRLYARILGPLSASNTESGDVAIGRVVCDRSLRGQGKGHELMARAISLASETWSGNPIKLSAQLYLQNFYAAHGFIAVGSKFLDHGIDHILMRRDTGAAKCV